MRSTKVAADRDRARPRQTARRRNRALPEVLVEHRRSIEPDVYLIDTLQAAPARTVKRPRRWKPRMRTGLRLLLTMLAGLAAAIMLPSFGTSTSGTDERPAVISQDDPDDSLAAAILEDDIERP